MGNLKIDKPSVSTTTDRFAKSFDIDANDLENEVGKIVSIWIDIKSLIKSLFNSKTANEISTKEKIDIYKKNKYNALHPSKKAFVDLTKYEVYSQKDIEKLKLLKKEYLVYEIFEAIEKKDLKKVTELLKKIEKESSSNYAAILFSLKKLEDINILSKEINDLINDKLSYIKQNPEPFKDNLKKISLIAGGILVFIGLITTGIYFYTKPSNLCNTERTFCARNIGYSREAMPQFDQKVLDAFLNTHYKGKATSETIAARLLFSTQNEINENKVNGMLANKNFDPCKNAILISKDNMIVDGHHRAAACFRKNGMIPVIKIDDSIHAIITNANNFAGVFRQSF